TRAEGIGGRRAQAWRLVDEIVPRPAWTQSVLDRALALAAPHPCAGGAGDRTGIQLTPLAQARRAGENNFRWGTARPERRAGIAELTVSGPDTDAPDSVAAIHALGADFWPLAMTRELDDLILDLRTNEPELGTWVLRTDGDPRRVLSYDELLLTNAGDWLAN